MPERQEFPRGRHQFFQFTLAAALAMTLPLPDAWAEPSDAAETAAETPEETSSLWDLTLTAGLNLAQGNEDTVLATSKIRAERLTDASEIRLGGHIDWGQTEGVTDTEEYGASAQFNRLLSERFYLGVVGDYFHDDIGDLDYRISGSPLAGYYIVKGDKIQLSIEAGPSHTWEKEAGVTENYWGLRFAERLTWRISKGSKLWQSFVYLPELGDFGNFVLESELGLSTRLTERLSLETVLGNSYDNRVGANVEKSDTRITASLAYALGKIVEDTAPPLTGDSTGQLPRHEWKTAASLGLSLLRGNSDNTKANAEIIATREFDSNILALSAGGAYGDSAGKTTINNVTAAVDYKHLAENDRCYWGARSAFLQDDIADVDYRFTTAVSLGLFFVKNERTKLNAEIGPAYVIESVGGQSDSFPALRAAQAFEHRFNDSVRIWESVAYVPELADFNAFTIEAEAGIETKINQHLSLKTYLRNRYDNVPARSRKANDLTLVSALSFTL